MREGENMGMRGDVKGKAGQWKIEDGKWAMREKQSGKEAGFEDEQEGRGKMGNEK